MDCLFMWVVLGILAWQFVGYLMTCSTGCKDYFVPIWLHQTKPRTCYIEACGSLYVNSWWKSESMFEKMMIPPVHLPPLSHIHCQ